MRRRVATVVLCCLPFLAAAPARADLGSRIASSQGRDRSLSAQIGSESARIAGFQGRIADLRARLSGLQASLDAEQAQLESLQRRLRRARGRLVQLKLAYARDRRVLADQLVGQYELPRPDIVSVVLASRGFSELLETASSLKAMADHNTSVTTRVREERVAVRTQARELKGLTAQQERVTAAALVQRDEVSQIERALVVRRSRVVQSRAAKRAQLASLRRSRKRLEDRLASIQARATGFAGAGPGLPSGGAPSYSAHGGAYGFFAAAGTNYSYGREPMIAARLDVMGKALHLHLIGISGYRSPQHSVEVGGFANDPHTKGEASDTPGLEGVPEATLNRYGLTRPFPGAAEADHVQLAGSTAR